MRHISILVLMTLLTVVCSTSLAQQNGVRPAPETLVWTYADFDELRSNARAWHEQKGIDGFIFCFVNRKECGPPRIDSGPDKIRQIYEGLPETVEALKKAGIRANFVHAGLDDPSWNWLDETHVAKLAPTFKTLGRVARESGCRGVAIDTEAYSSTLWDPTKYPDVRRAEIEKRIYDTGAAVMDGMLSEFPDAEILVLPEGAYFNAMGTPRGNNTYVLWMKFFNGMASRKPAKGITIMTESAYHQKDPLKIAVMHGRLQAAMMLLSEDPHFWLTKCSIAHGADLCLKEKVNQTRSPEEFAKQWQAMGELSSRYRWIFAGESGLTFCPSAVPALGIGAFGEPLCKNADAYFNILRSSRAKQ
ncbi:MAG TPA: hypothetical protein VGK34_01315 [Armatimonadota bacterium]|jgi:hypothetical protein